MTNDDITDSEQPALSCARTIDLGIYLVGGMSDSESRTMRVHIDTCTWCSAELRSLRPVADLLDATELASSIIGERLEPTPDAASRLFARASAELASTTFSSVTVASSAVASVSPISAARSNPSHPSSSDRSRRKTRTMVAAGIAVFSLGVGSTVGTQRLVAQDHKPTKKLENVRFASVSLQAPDPENPSPNSPPASGPGVVPKAWASIDQTPAGTYAYLYVRDFEIGRVYRWWFIKRDGTRVPLGSFKYPGAVDGDEWLRCPGHTALERTELIAIGATNEEGFDVVRQDLPTVPKLIAT